MASLHEPPDDFMRATEINWRHDFRQGIHDGFSWLQSRQIHFHDFFDWMKPPTEGFRLLITAVDGCPGASPYQIEEGWIIGERYGLSPLMHHWPQLIFTGNGEALFVLDASSTLSNIDEIPNKYVEVSGYEQLDDLSLPEIRQFWDSVNNFNPLFYMCDWALFSFVSRSETNFEQFIEADSFKNIEAKLEADTKSQRLSLWKYYWDAIGPECGPEPCVQPGCDRLRIHLAIRCLRHQLESNNPGWFDNGLYFNSSTKRLDLLSAMPTDSTRMTTFIDKGKALIAFSESSKAQFLLDPFQIQSVPQKIFSAVRWLEGEVFNGGFVQYFTNSSSETAPFVVTALETIGALKALNISKRAISTAFPDGLPETQQEIADSADARYDELAKALESIDQEFFACADELTEKLFQFVVRHPDEFGDVIGLASPAD
jgi:hypothetical protein